MKAILTLLFLLGFSPIASAQHVEDCVTEFSNGERTSAGVIVEPWEENSKAFANGDVRLSYMDTEDPANYSAYLMVLSPPRDELGGRQCKIISMHEGLGFASLTFSDLIAGYDAKTGLVFKVPVTTHDNQTSIYTKHILVVTVNQATGLVTAAFE